MSADLTWMLVRNRSSFLVKRNGVQLTSEPNNVTNINSYKFSGLANKKSVSVVEGNTTKKGGKVVACPALTTKSVRNASRPKRATAVAPLNGSKKSHNGRHIRAITKVTAGSGYRGDLTKFAVARYEALARATRMKPAVQRTKRGKLSRKALSK